MITWDGGIGSIRLINKMKMHFFRLKLALVTYPSNEKWTAGSLCDTSSSSLAISAPNSSRMLSVVVEFGCVWITAALCPCYGIIISLRMF
jgi:hypothetical protein